MQAKLEELNRTMPTKKGVTWPGQVRIGIGLNSGICCVGNMGSRQRLDYSLIGDTVNLAARLEGQTKYYGVPIIVGSGTARALDGFALLEVDRIRVVGRDRPETIFGLLGDSQFAQIEEAHELAEGHGRMLAAYRSADWEEAARLLEELSDQYVALGLDKLNALFWNRVTELRASPPDPGWDGIFEASAK
jgi:adenylate cyclase